MKITATYSPEDNKLRLYADERLDADTYARVKAAGYHWAPKQKLFVAPMWTPSREDLAEDLAGEILDEDMSLAQRSEVRAERFEGYRENRIDDAYSALDYVQRLGGNADGRPVVFGHQQARFAERQAKRMKRGMERAVDMWDTAEYWRDRAAGAIRNAKYKELPDVRARRIKGIEADLRKAEKEIEDAEKNYRIWDKIPRFEWDRQTELATMLAGRLTNAPVRLYSALKDGRMHGDTAWREAQAAALRVAAHYQRWADHYNNRLAYERAMLEAETDSGSVGAKMAAGLTEGWDIKPGGRVRIGSHWMAVVRVNRKEGRIISVTTSGRYGGARGIEDIEEYEPPTEETAAAVKVLTTKSPLTNYESPGCAKMTQAQWNEIYKDSKGTRVEKENETHASHRRRVVMAFIGRKYGAVSDQAYGMVYVFLTDAKQTDAPLLNPPEKKPRKSTARKIAESMGVDTSGEQDEAPPPVPTQAQARAQAREALADFIAPSLTETLAEAERLQRLRQQEEQRRQEAAPFEKVRDTLAAGGVTVVTAHQLFPTPADLAQRMANMADIKPGDRVLEPSAGTGMLLGACGGRMFPAEAGLLQHGAKLNARDYVVAVEINAQLCQRLRSDFPLTTVHCADFLSVDPAAARGIFGVFDVILMNPPFENGADIKHIQHARKFLAPGGRLIAICANGPRQQAQLEPICDLWEPLPDGTFAAAGTNVRTALLTIYAEAAAKVAA